MFHLGKCSIACLPLTIITSTESQEPGAQKNRSAFDYNREAQKRMCFPAKPVPTDFRFDSRQFSADKRITNLPSFFFPLSLSFAGLRSNVLGADSFSAFFFSAFKFVRLETVFVARQCTEQHSTLDLLSGSNIRSRLPKG